MRPLVLALLCAAVVVWPAKRSQADVDASAPIPAATPMQLVVIEAKGCIYCNLFRRDLLPAYQASEQAKQMPVRFVDVNDIESNHLDFTSPVQIVPTFVVVKSNHEIGRISGYVGPEDFFHSIKYLLASAP